tara:strand:+ start:79682 stop:81925 length:2244 start_codon:yes stop_codon:yes gene_type:complete
LAGEGLTRFYELGGAATGAVGSEPRVPAFDWLHEWEQRNTTAGVVRMTLDVQGIRCAACVWLLQAIWQRVAPGRPLQVSSSMGQVTMQYVSDSDVGRRFLEMSAKLGYPMAPPSRRVARDTGLLVRLGICVAVAMNAMILAISLYFGLDTATINASDAVLRDLFGWVLLGLASVSVVVGGPVFFRAALAGVRAGVVHMDLPVSLGVLLAFGGSVYGQLTGGATYFDTVAIFVAFMLGGRYLQQRTLAKNRDQVLADDGAEHLRARRVRNGLAELVPIQQLEVGDEIILAPGDLVPTRGVLLGEASLFSLDWINGESEARSFAAAQEVPAGAFHAARMATRLRVTSTYYESGLAELLSQEPVDREDTAGRVRFWDRLNRYYALGVLLAALVGAVAWSFVDPSRAIPVAVAVLVVTCPCAMGIATPLAFHLALARLRRNGVFVRTKSLLDKARVLRHVVFDKTGTVTFGGLRARALEPVPEEALPVLASMAASSNHPVSQAVLASLQHAPVLDTMRIAEFVGQGLVADYAGAKWCLGSRAFCGLEEHHTDSRECVLTRNGRLVVAFELEEDFRTGAAEEFAALRARGLEVHLMSGDRPERVALAAAHLGLPGDHAHGGMSPSDKARAVAALDDRDTLMVGDGLNDAPAFDQAFCAGTPAMDRPVLPARSDFCFRGAQAGAVLSLCEVAEEHARVVRTNLTLALIYNASVLTLAFAGLMTPLLCAVLMPISSVALVLHTSIRMQRTRRLA